MIGFSEILALLALAVALVALYLVADAIKKAEGENRRLLETQLGDIRRKMEKTARAVLALEEKGRELEKSVAGLHPLMDERAQEIRALNEELDDLRVRLTALDRSIPPKFRTHIVSPPQNRVQ